MNSKQIMLLAAVLFFITAGVWFFNGERNLAILFFVIACALAAISFNSKAK